MVKIKKDWCYKQKLSSFSRIHFWKRGEITWELIRTILFVILLVTMIFIVIVLLKGKGGDLLDSVTRIMRFGR